MVEKKALTRLAAFAVTFALLGCSSGAAKFEKTGRLEVPVYPVTHSSPAGAEAENDRAGDDSDFRRAQYFNGSSDFVNSKPQIEQVRLFGDDKASLNFINTDIRIILRAVLSDTLGLSFMADPRVQGTATLESSSEISKDALYGALEVLLKTKGFAIVESTDGLLVLPLSEAPQHVKSLEAGTPASVNLPSFGVQIVPLKYTSASEMENLLRPFAPQGAVLRADNVRNILILAGTSRELTSMTGTIATFDVDWMAGMSFAIYSFKYAEADQIQTELQEIYEAPGVPSSGAIRFISIPRINKLLAIAPQRTLLKDVERWISKLDSGESSPGRRIYIYSVKNGRAGDLAQTLNQILGTGYNSGYGASNVGNNNRNTNTRTNNRSSSNRSGRNTQNSTNNNSGGIGGDQLRIVPNEENNSVVILATPSEFGVIEAALKQVDVAPRQVLIEVTLAEITLTDELRFGMQWHFEFGDNAVSFGKSASPSAEFPGFSWSHTNQSSASAVLNAIEAMTDVQVISSPKLMVLNNQPALIQVGDEVPVPTASAVSSTDTNAPIVNSIEYRSTGVILSVTPRINEGGLVMMDVEQEVSSVVETASSGIDAPTIQSRKVTSSIAVQDGSTVALGGLIRRSISNVNSGVPFLKNVPLLGNLFKETDLVERRSELIILITPRIIRDVTEQQEVMDYLQQEFRSLIAPSSEAAVQE